MSTLCLCSREPAYVSHEFQDRDHLHAAAVLTVTSQLQVMFLAEAVLGEEHHITRDDPSLKQAPTGFHSVVARGYTEPDPSQDFMLDLEGNDVRVADYEKSSFSKSEYLLYKESQARIRYMLTMRFDHRGSWR